MRQVLAQTHETQYLRPNAQYHCCHPTRQRPIRAMRSRATPSRAYEIDQLFGGAEKLLQAVDELQKFLYE